MPSKFPYLKALVLFPLLAQIIGTLVSIYVDENTDELFTTADVVLFSLLATFIVATVPAVDTAKGYLKFSDTAEALHFFLPREPPWHTGYGWQQGRGN